MSQEEKRKARKKKRSGEKEASTGEKLDKINRFEQWQRESGIKELKRQVTDEIWKKRRSA